MPGCKFFGWIGNGESWLVLLTVRAKTFYKLPFSFAAPSTASASLHPLFVTHKTPQIIKTFEGILP